VAVCPAPKRETNNFLFNSFLRFFNYCQRTTFKNDYHLLLLPFVDSMRSKSPPHNKRHINGAILAIAVTFLWLGTLSAYCSSKQQLLLERPLSKLSGWGIFVIFFFIAWLFLMGSYSSLSAFFLALSYVMAAWLTTIFILAHFQLNPWQFGSTGAAISIALFYMGRL